MLSFAIERLVPHFLLNDRNGYAVSKAIEAALNALCAVVQQGTDLVLDVEKMPEWRLDEMAWELACLYDYTASAAEKRKWIRESIPLFSLYGTAQAIYCYLNGMFDAVTVEEFWQYGADPFHFRVTVNGELTDAKEAWIRTAVGKSQNVRSVLDNIAVGSGTARIEITAEGGVLTRVYSPAAGDALCGTLPE